MRRAEAAWQPSAGEGRGKGAMSMDLEYEDRDGVVVMRLNGALDEAALPSVKAAIARALAGGARGILLDFGGVNRVEAEVLGGLLAAYGRCREAGIALKLACLHPRVARRFFEARLNRVFELFDNAATALLTFPCPDSRRNSGGIAHPGDGS